MMLIVPSKNLCRRNTTVIVCLTYSINSATLAMLTQERHFTITAFSQSNAEMQADLGTQFSIKGINIYYKKVGKHYNDTYYRKTILAAYILKPCVTEKVNSK